MAFTLLPAVDVADGQAVRLVQGEVGIETTCGAPRDAALAWQVGGAEWIHLVDLDAAFGRGSNAELLAAVIGELDVKVELSGGIRDDTSLERALSTDCARVILGTAALEDPAWCGRAIAAHGERIAVALDVRVVEDPDGPVQYRLAARGCTRDGGDLWVDPRAAGPGRLRSLRRHRREQGRHAARPERGALPGGHPRHHCPGDRLWRIYPYRASDNRSARVPVRASEIAGSPAAQRPPCAGDAQTEGTERMCRTPRSDRCSPGLEPGPALRLPDTFKFWLHFWLWRSQTTSPWPTSRTDSQKSSSG